MTHFLQLSANERSARTPLCGCSGPFIHSCRPRVWNKQRSELCTYHATLCTYFSMYSGMHALLMGALAKVNGKSATLSILMRPVACVAPTLSDAYYFNLQKCIDASSYYYANYWHICLEQNRTTKQASARCRLKINVMRFALAQWALLRDCWKTTTRDSKWSCSCCFRVLILFAQHYISCSILSRNNELEQKRLIALLVFTANNEREK